MPTAISFTAFCTAGQPLSLDARRHIEDASEWCQHAGYTLEQYAQLPDDTPPLEACEPCLAGLYLLKYRIDKGLIKRGSALVIETLKGVPKLELNMTVTLLKELMQAGLKVVTLVDGRVFYAGSTGGLVASVVDTYSESI